MIIEKVPSSVGPHTQSNLGIVLERQRWPSVCAEGSKGVIMHLHNLARSGLDVVRSRHCSVIGQLSKFYLGAADRWG